MLAPDLTVIRIVLVEPAGPLNVGSVARVMKNMGLSQLVLVNPQCDPWGDEAQQMAVHAADVLAAAQVVTSLPDALVGCQRAIATTGRPHTTLPIPLESPRVALPWLCTKDAQPGALIFGREDSGLTNEELNYAQRFVQIPTSPVYPSMNLAQAVAVCCYELAVAARGSGSKGDWPEPADESGARNNDEALAELGTLERFYRHLESVLLAIGYLYPHTAASRMKKLRRLLNRAYPTQTEVAMLQGILSQVEWALKPKKRNKD